MGRRGAWPRRVPTLTAIAGLLAAASGCAVPDLPPPALPSPDRRTVVEQHSTTQAPGSPLSSDAKLPEPVTPPPAETD
jgi:hypothetical protein